MGRATKVAIACLVIVAGAAVVAVVSGRQTSLPDEFHGRWYYMGSSGGIAGEVVDTADGSWIVITDGSEIERYSPTGDLLSTESLPVSVGPTIFGSEDAWIVDEDSPVPRVLMVDGDVLRIADNVYDGFGSSYRRTR